MPFANGVHMAARENLLNKMAKKEEPMYPTLRNTTELKRDELQELADLDLLLDDNFSDSVSNSSSDKSDSIDWSDL